MPKAVSATVPSTPKRAMTSAEWGVLALLASSVFINYIDRGSLSIAAPVLTKELSLNPSDLGILLSAFFWTYATFQLVAGWLVDRYPVKWVFGIGFLLWSGATALTGFTSGVSMLIGLRVILGAGEAVAYPAYSKIIAAGFSENQRGVINALIDAASKCGPALGTVVGAMVVGNYGWRSLFWVLGFGGLIWLIPWFKWAPHTESRASSSYQAGPGFMRIMQERSAWGTFICLFCINYAWYFILTWLPSYLVSARGYSMQDVAFLGSMPLWVLAASATVCGFASDRFITNGASPTLVRKGFTSTGMVLTMLFLMPAALVENATASIVLITLSCVAFGFTTSNHWAITQSMAGPLAAGKWTGLQNCLGNFAGVVAPILTGKIVHATGSFYWAFVLVGGFLVCGAASFIWIVGPVKQVNWDTPGK